MNSQQTRIFKNAQSFQGLNVKFKFETLTFSLDLHLNGTEVVTSPTNPFMHIHMIYLHIQPKEVTKMFNFSEEFAVHSRMNGSQLTCNV